LKNFSVTYLYLLIRMFILGPNQTLETNFER